MKTRLQKSIYAWPLVIGVLSSIGLLTALIGDGAWDSISWVALGFPTLLCGWVLIGSPLPQR